jgi:hypothetical protein
MGTARAIVPLRLLATSFQKLSHSSAIGLGMAEFMAIAQHGKRFDDYPRLAQAAAARCSAIWSAELHKPARASA